MRDIRVGIFQSPRCALSDLTDPQSINRYVYARNAPLSIVDPTGLDGCEDAGTDCFFPDEAPLQNGTEGPNDGDQSSGGQDGSQPCVVGQNCGTFDCDLSDNSCSVDAHSICVNGNGAQLGSSCQDYTPYDPNGDCQSTFGNPDYPCGPGGEVTVTPDSTPSTQNNASSGSSSGPAQDLLLLFEAQEKVELPIIKKVLIPGAMISTGVLMSAGSVEGQVWACAGGPATCAGAAVGTVPTFLGGLTLAGEGAYYLLTGKFYNPVPKP